MSNSINTSDIGETSQTLTKNLETTEDINVILNSRTMEENFDAGFKIMGLGMVAVFGVLTILYIAIKIMGHFAKGDNNEKN